MKNFSRHKKLFFSVTSVITNEGNKKITLSVDDNNEKINNRFFGRGKTANANIVFVIDEEHADKNNLTKDMAVGDRIKLSFEKVKPV